jgi:hypothetical protein
VRGKRISPKPARVAKVDGTTNAWIYDFGAKESIGAVALIHHNMDAGMNVCIKGKRINPKPKKR